jgi:hypothetical protein
MIPAQRQQQLEQIRALLPQQLRRRLHSARELARQHREEEQGLLPTALPALDLLLAGGLPRGQLVELTGSRSSGRFSTVLQILAAATGVGEAAALVDLGDGLDPADALAMGIDAARLLWLRPATLKQALAAAEMVLGSGFQLVVLDLGTPPLARGGVSSVADRSDVSARGPGGSRSGAAAWLRLARAAKAQASALLVSSPYRVSGTAASIVLQAGRGPSLWGQGSACLLGGIAPRLTLDKGRGRRHGQHETLSLRLPGSLPPSSPRGGGDGSVCKEAPAPGRDPAHSKAEGDGRAYVSTPQGARPRATPQTGPYPPPQQAPQQQQPRGRVCRPASRASR